MPTNVEIKAKVKDMAKFRSIAADLSKSEGQLIEQEDTFFNAPNGRLKLRQLKGAPAQLIFYDRPDQAGPKTCQFFWTEIQHPSELKVVLEKSMGTKGEVKKSRMLYMVGQTRIHADEVDGLGTFMELEVCLEEGQSEVEGQKIADDLRQKLGVQEDDLLTCAYMDLILRGKVNGSAGDH